MYKNIDEHIYVNIPNNYKVLSTILYYKQIVPAY